MPTAKQQFLDAHDREHATTMRRLRAYPKDKADLRPDPKLRTARELAWGFATECGMGVRVYNDELAKGFPSGKVPQAPQSWDEVLSSIEKAHQDFRELVSKASDEDLLKKVRFFSGPKTMGEFPRLDVLWFLLSDQIHHRGQFSIYARIAGGKVPSIYGPSADEPWM